MHLNFRNMLDFPPVAQSIDKVREQTSGELYVDVQNAKTDVINFHKLISSEGVSARMNVEVVGNELLLNVDADIGSLNLSLGVRTVGEANPLLVNGKLFMEGLLISDALLVGVNWVMFFKEDIKYLMMIMS